LEKIHIGVAWPYANGPLHLGHVAGIAVPCDIFARYHRLKGNRVLMVSGSDEHGTPIAMTAEAQGKSPQEVVDHYHAIIKKSLEDLGMTYDLYTRTTTENHYEEVTKFFLRLLENGYIYEDTQMMPYSAGAKRYLADRYVEGTCPHCGYDKARGNECPECGQALNPEELIDPRCALTGETPEWRERNYFYLDLVKLAPRLRAWAEEHHGVWREKVYNVTIKYLDDMKNRAVTRDIEWGVPVPVEGWEDQRIYVWFDAVLGYFTATVEYYKLRGEPEGWRQWWEDPEVKRYNFIGKDNTFFHTVIWPGMLLAHGDLVLPYDVPANEYLNLEGGPFSTSLGRAIWLPDFLERYDPDPLRFYLAINMPQYQDTNFSWSEFVTRNNSELAGAWGNLVNRVLSPARKNYREGLPRPADLSDADEALLAKVRAAFDEVGGLIEACKFKEALQALMTVIRATNLYIQEREPWRAVKEDPADAERIFHTAITAINNFTTMMSPFVPFSCQKVHEYLGFEGEVTQRRWEFAEVPAENRLKKPKPLYKILDESVVEEERAKLGTD